mmetsp:Transcript_9410/g.31879  ORF Transcript_9410/g.31879 Transcript_9410/m.31879 type:complete len:254 (-) Transcript_9410:364-1125(-)
MASSRRGWATPRVRTARRPALVALPMATVATGTPRGICTMDSSESFPLRVEVFTGTPTTGSGVMAATMPGRCAAPPAPAMITLRPRSRASLAYETRRSGVRCAETMVTSKGTPKCCRTSAAPFIVGRSESEPMMTPTTGLSFSPHAAPSPESRRAMTASTSAAESPTTLMCPILRFGLASFLPYQWTVVLGTERERSMGARAAARASSGVGLTPPITLSMPAAGTMSSGLPSGRPRTARMCCSNWSVAQLSWV